MDLAEASRRLGEHAPDVRRSHDARSWQVLADS